MLITATFLFISILYYRYFSMMEQLAGWTTYFLLHSLISLCALIVLFLIDLYQLKDCCAGQITLATKVLIIKY